mmetsp:Transcript_14267/g.50080  ORF Transcript_14267/g.50080 Transcript_14267/m.50080 type:complete len:244 (+) Transcript_14267:233-964(+)
MPLTCRRPSCSLYGSWACVATTAGQASLPSSCTPHTKCLRLRAEGKRPHFSTLTTCSGVCACALSPAKSPHRQLRRQLRRQARRAARRGARRDAAGHRHEAGQIESERLSGRHQERRPSHRVKAIRLSLRCCQHLAVPRREGGHGDGNAAVVAALQQLPLDRLLDGGADLDVPRQRGRLEQLHDVHELAEEVVALHVHADDPSDTLAEVDADSAIHLLALGFRPRVRGLHHRQPEVYHSQRQA